jgi:hypothetical protein
MHVISPIGKSIKISRLMERENVRRFSLDFTKNKLNKHRRYGISFVQTRIFNYEITFKTWVRVLTK